jgi:hypothetical protein
MGYPISNSNFKIFGSKTSTNNKKNPSGSDSGSGYDGCEYGNLPYFEPEPIQKTRARAQRIEEHVSKLEPIQKKTIRY